MTDRADREAGTMGPLFLAMEKIAARHLPDVHTLLMTCHYVRFPDAVPHRVLCKMMEPRDRDRLMNEFVLPGRVTAVEDRASLHVGRVLEGRGRDTGGAEVVIREVGDRVDPIAEVTPERVDVARPGEAPRHPDDRHAVRRIEWALATHCSSSLSAYSPAGSPNGGCSS